MERAVEEATWEVETGRERAAFHSQYSRCRVRRSETRHPHLHRHTRHPTCSRALSTRSQCTAPARTWNTRRSIGRASAGTAAEAMDPATPEREAPWAEGMALARSEEVETVPGHAVEAPACLASTRRRRVRRACGTHAEANVCVVSGTYIQVELCNGSKGACNLRYGRRRGWARRVGSWRRSAGRRWAERRRRRWVWRDDWRRRAVGVQPAPLCDRRGA